MKNLFALIFTALAFAGLSPVAEAANTLKCFDGEAKSPFVYIQENFPSEGLATIKSNGHSSILKFTQEEKVMNTRVGLEVFVKKTYSHPYYEYQLHGRKLLGKEGPVSYYGSISTEQNGHRAITCAVAEGAQ